MAIKSVTVSIKDGVGVQNVQLQVTELGYATLYDANGSAITLAPGDVVRLREALANLSAATVKRIGVVL